jgi:glycosyltransferase involved in cell wall biosynthesis
MHTISICIPTKNRPELLRVALESCFNQTTKPDEIVIGDNSTDDATANLVGSISSASAIEIRYLRNQRPTDLANNMNNLFAAAIGTWVIMLHDDDVLTPCAIADYLAAVAAQPDLVIVYGREYIINFNGGILDEETRNNNIDYCRTESRLGIQRSIMESAIDGQIPNNGYMVVRSIGARIGFRGPDEVGLACDYDFGIRLAAAHPDAKAYLVSSFTHCTRRTPGGASTLGQAAPYAYRQVSELLRMGIEKMACERALVRLAPVAAKDAILLGNRLEAWKIFFSPYCAQLRWKPEGLRFWAYFLNPFPQFTKTLVGKLARNYLASVCLAAALVWWI